MSSSYRPLAPIKPSSHRLRDPLEGLGVALLLVGVVLQGLSAERLHDLLLGGVPAHAEDLVVAARRHGTIAASPGTSGHREMS